MIVYRTYTLIATIIICSILLFICPSCTLSMSKEEQTKNMIQTPSVDKSVQALSSHDFITSPHWPEKNWWENYKLEELNELILKALDSNPSIQAIYERISFAQSQVVIAQSKLFPLIYFNTSDNWEYLSQTGVYRKLNPNIGLNKHLFDFGLSFSYEFDFWGKYKNLYQASIGEKNAQIAEAAQVRLIITTALAQVYFALKTNLIREKIYQELYQVKKNYFELQKTMLKHCLYSKLPPLLSEESVFEAEQNLYAIEKEILSNKHLINILLGQGPDEVLILDESLSLLPPKLAVPDDISIELLSRRPDLMAQIWHVEALAHEVGAAKADYWPNISITGLAGFSSTSFSKLFDMISKTVGLLPALKLPLYTAGAIGAHIEGKKALFQQAIYQYNEMILASYQQVADLLALGSAIYQSQEKQNQIIDHSLRRYQLILNREQSGLDSALTSYQYLESLLKQKLTHAKLLYDQYLVSIQLIKSLGGGYVKDAGYD